MATWHEATTVIDMLKRNVEDFPQRECYIAESYITGQEVRLTWKEMDQASNKVAAALGNSGVKKGSKVAYLMTNCAEDYSIYLGVLKLGAIFVPTNNRLVGRELEYIFNHSETEYLILGDQFLKTIGEIKSKIPLIQKYVVLAPQGRSIPSWTVSFESLLAEAPSDYAEVEIQPSDVTDIVYTTGTTGRPKGCVLIHSGKVACGRLLGASTEMARLYYAWPKRQEAFPFFTSTGVSSIMMTWLYYGFTAIHETKFDVEQALATIQKEKTTAYGAAPSMYILIMNHPKFKDYDTSSLKYLSYGGSVMPVEVMKQIFENWPKARLMNSYGLTEGGTGGTTLSAFDALRKPASIGKPWLPDQEVRIVNENEEDVGVEEIGEIILRGPNIMKGYYKDPEATAKALKNGWLYTGDLGKYDEESYIYYCDRKKDMIVRGGFNVYPVEIEDVIYEHPAVKQCAVIAKSHKVLGEDVLAVIVLREGMQVSAQEIMDFCIDKLADYKRPREVVFMEALPINPMGKTDKKILRELMSRR